MKGIKIIKIIDKWAEENDVNLDEVEDLADFLDRLESDY